MAFLSSVYSSHGPNVLSTLNVEPPSLRRLYIITWFQSARKPKKSDWCGTSELSSLADEGSSLYPLAWTLYGLFPVGDPSASGAWLYHRALTFSMAAFRIAHHNSPDVTRPRWCRTLTVTISDQCEGPPSADHRTSPGSTGSVSCSDAA